LFLIIDECWFKGANYDSVGILIMHQFWKQDFEIIGKACPFFQWIETQWQKPDTGKTKSDYHYSLGLHLVKKHWIQIGSNKGTM